MSLTPATSVLADDHTFNPATVLELRVSFFRQFFQLLPKTLGDNFNEQFGIQGTLGSEPFNSGIAGLSNPGSNPYAPEFRADNQFEYSGKLTRLVSNHTLTMGAKLLTLAGLHGCGAELSARPVQLRRDSDWRPQRPGNIGQRICRFLLGLSRICPSPIRRQRRLSVSQQHQGILQRSVAGSAQSHSESRIALGVRWPLLRKIQPAFKL